MSGVLALWNRDDEPLDPDQVGRMATRLRHRGPDASGAWMDGSVALAHTLLRTTAAGRGRQPLRDPIGALCIALDGRIDNRVDLHAALGVGGDDREEPDAALILRAYARWDTACVGRLLGDFAFALWDGPRRRLVCARDALGIKPLYYVSDRRRFACASELGPFRAHPGITMRVNERVVGEYLACGITTIGETLYEDVQRLPPAHVIVADERGDRLERYWTIDPSHDIRHRSDAEYADHLGALLNEAVRCRTRGAERIGVLLSGGLDSSTVAALAATLERDAGVTGLPVTAFSLVFPGRDCDETPYIDAVTTRFGIDSVRVQPPAVDRRIVDAEAELFADFPTYANTATSDAARAAAAAAGVRVLLTGEGGDEWLWGSCYRYADLLRTGRLVALFREWRGDSSIAAAGSAVFPRWRMLRLGVWPLLPEPVRRLARTLRGRPARPAPPPWLDRRFASRIDLVDRTAAGFDRRPGESFSRAHMRSPLGRATDTHYLELIERSGARVGIEERHPFYDRRVVEFALAVPQDQLWRRASTKYVLRGAMRGILPESVRCRVTKADFLHTYALALASAGGARVVRELHPWLADRLDVPHVDAMFRRLESRTGYGDDRYTEDVWACWMIYATDRWLRAVDTRAELS